MVLMEPKEPLALKVPQVLKVLMDLMVPKEPQVLKVLRVLRVLQALVLKEFKVHQEVEDQLQMIQPQML